MTAAGIRGRGGAGFPTGVKWRTVAANASAIERSTVVVNAAEGEPGSFKDRELLDRNPYRVIEGALIGALAVGADEVVIGMKRTATRHIARVRAAIAEVQASRPRDRRASSTSSRDPPEYLLGEETALLEAIDGRYPFPRIAPPYRRGVDEMVETAGRPRTRSRDCRRTSRWPGPTPTPERRRRSSTTSETLAHVTVALAEGADWFREVGTDESPGTVLCTVSGCIDARGRR